MVNLVKILVDYVKDDWASSPIRTMIEIYAWLAATTAALIFSFTVPTPALTICYPLWISAMLCMAGCAYTRGSFGIVALNLTTFLIDIVGYIRTLLYS